jgi:hypothetical protein
MFDSQLSAMIRLEYPMSVGNVREPMTDKPTVPVTKRFVLQGQVLKEAAPLSQLRRQLGHRPIHCGTWPVGGIASWHFLPMTTLPPNGLVILVNVVRMPDYRFESWYERFVEPFA